MLLPAKSYNENVTKYWKDIEHEITNGEFFYLKKYTDAAGKLYFNVNSWNLFKVVDLLELWFFCKEETVIGNHNQSLKIIIRNCENLIFPHKFRYVNDILGGLKDELWK